MPNLDTPNPADNRKVFQLRCEARALLWQADELSLHDAVDELEAMRRQFGIDADVAQAIMAQAFAAVRDDL